MMQIKCKKLKIFTNLHRKFTVFSTCLAVKGQDDTSGYMLVSTSYDSGTSSEQNILVFVSVDFTKPGGDFSYIEINSMLPSPSSNYYLYAQI